MSGQTARRDRVRPVAGIGAGIYAVATALGVIPAMIAPFLFDAPGSEKRVVLWILFGLLPTLPIDFLVATIALGLAAWKRWPTVMIFALVMPMLHVVAIVATFAFL